MQSLKKMTDDQLVTAYAQGNNPAFDELLLRHKQREIGRASCRERVCLYV